MLVFTPVVIFTVQELGVLGSWREMEISSMQMELILKNLRTTNWYSSFLHAEFSIVSFL